jgi:hypothetical protein
MFREDNLTIDCNVKDPIAAFDKFRFTLNRFCDFCCQTGGFREILSTTTVGDGYIHYGFDPTASATQFTRRIRDSGIL